MRHPSSLLLTSLPIAAALALSLGCPSRSGGKAPETPAAHEVPKVAAPDPLAPAPAPLVLPVEQPKPRTARPRLAKAVATPHLTPAPAAATVSATPAVPTSPAPPAPGANPSPAPAAGHPPTVPALAPPQAAALLAPSAQPTSAAPTKAAATAKASYRRIVESYGAQLALVSPTNGGLRLAAGGPSVALGVSMVWNLPKGLRLRPRLDYTVFASETRTSTAAPLSQTLSTRVSSLGLGADFLLPMGSRWGVGLAVSEIRWSVASTNTVTPTLGGSMTLSGTSHWTRLGYGPVVTFKASEHLEVEFRALSSHYGYENQPASTATVGLLWRF